MIGKRGRSTQSGQNYQFSRYYVQNPVQTVFLICSDIIVGMKADKTNVDELISSCIEMLASTLEKGSKLIAAVSGGADSVCLLHSLHKQFCDKNIQLFVAHLNHGIRGAEAVSDQDFVRDLAAKYKTDFYTESIDIPSMHDSSSLSMEMLCRRERLDFYSRALEKYDADWIVTGHTLSDQSETMLMRILRGTSLRGLAGMKPLSGRIARPLLNVPRIATREYCKIHNLDFRDDASNSDDSIFRNNIRNKLIPHLENEYNPNIQERLSTLAEHIRLDVDYLQSIALSAYEKSVINNNRDQNRLDINRLLPLHDAILSRVLIAAYYNLPHSENNPLTNEHIEAMVEIVRNENAGDRINLPGNIFMTRELGSLAFSHAPVSGETPYFEHHVAFPGKGENTIEHLNPPGMRIEIKLLQEIPEGIESNPNPWVAYLDTGNQLPEITIRSWRPGDRFQPLGMEGTKKLQDYFTDAHVACEQRKSTAVLLLNGTIAWVVGHRIDEQFKIKTQTENALYIKVDPNSDLMTDQGF